ncbi:MAG: phage portal protein [Aggregatilineales bacterium]
MMNDIQLENPINLRQLTEQHTVFYRVGNDLIDPSAYRSRYMQQWERALKGSPAGDAMLTEAVGQSATAYACIEKRSNTLSGLPTKICNRVGEDVDYHPVSFFQQDATLIYYLTEYALNTYGRSYLLKIRNPHNYPTRLQWVHPDFVEYDRERDIYTVRDEDTGQPAPVQPRNIIHIEPPRMSQKQSALDVAIARVGAEGGIMRFSASFFMNSAKPEGILLYKGGGKMDDSDKEKVKREWKQFQDPDNAHKTFVSGGEWEWIPITPNPVDLAMTELSNEIAEDICKIFAVNPALIGAATTADPLSAQNTYRNIERDFVENVILPRFDYILNELNRQWLWIDFRQKNLYTLTVDRRSIGILSDVTGENVTTATTLTGGGVGDFHEARATLGLEPRNDYFSRDPQQPLNTLGAGMVTIDESRALVGLQPLNGVNGRVVQVAPGVWIPADSIYEYALATLDNTLNPPEPAGFGGMLNHPEADIRSAVRGVLDGELSGFMLRMFETLLHREPVGIEPELPPTPELPQPEGEKPVTRNVSRIDLSISLSENSFVRGMVRVLSERLTTFDITPATWLDETRWQIPLVSLPDATINDASVLMKSVALDEALKIDVVTDGAFVRDGTLYLRIHETPELLTLRNDIVSTLIGQGYSVPNASNWQPGIPVAYIADLPQPEALAIEAAYPLVLNNVALLLDSEQLHDWSLRHYTPSQHKELVNWKHKATRKKSAAVRFIPDKLDGTVIPDFIRWMTVLGHDTETIFTRAFEVLAGERGDKSLPVRANITEDIPDDFATYWADFDTLTSDIGDDWLNSYMGRAWDALKNNINPELKQVDIEQALRSNRDSLLNEWVGTKDAPGSVTRLLMAGMAAGHELLVAEIPDTVRRYVRAVDIAIDWDVLNEDALQFARSYTYNLISGLDSTTMRKVQRAVSKWIEDMKVTLSGETTGVPLTIADLTESIETIFNNPVRAEMIAETEATRVYNRGSEQRWKKVGVQRARWVTSRDSKVCDICAPLHGTISEIGAGHEHPGGFQREDGLPQLDARKHAGKRFDSPAHTRCRCGKKPVVDANTPTLNPSPDAPPADPVDIIKAQAQRDFSERRKQAQNMTVRNAMKQFRRELDEVSRQLDEVVTQRSTDVTRRLEAKQQGIEHHATRYQQLNEDVARHYRDLNARTDIDDDERERIRNDIIAPIVAEREQVADTWHTAQNEAVALAEERSAVARNFGIELGKASPEMQLKARARVRKFENIKDQTADAVEWLSQTFNGNTYRMEKQVSVRRKRSRAYFDQASGDIYISEYDKPETYIHEFGHAIEAADPAIHARCVEFLEARTAQESEQPMSVLMPGRGYRANEVTKADAFPDPYVGKQYISRNKTYATEILSMGLQYLYTDPVTFQRTDPEYFEFIISITRGYIT